MNTTGLIVALCLLAFAKPILKFLFRSAVKALSNKTPKPFVSKVYVIDGDTVVAINGDLRIRLHGIDAPEKAQHQGIASTVFLREISQGHDIKIKPVGSDRYGRIVATLIRQSDNTNLNQAMVQYGFALADERYTKAYLKLQKRAKRTKAGLWSQGAIENPRKFRESRL